MANIENFCESSMTFKQIHAVRIANNILSLLDSDHKNMLSLCECVKTGAIQINRAKREIRVISEHFDRYYEIIGKIGGSRYLSSPELVEIVRKSSSLFYACCEMCRLAFN